MFLGLGSLFVDIFQLSQKEISMYPWAEHTDEAIEDIFTNLKSNASIV